MTTTDSQAAVDRAVELKGLPFSVSRLGQHVGALDQPALVTSHAHSKERFAQSMREHYWVLALDQRGHGQTAWTTDYHATRRVEGLEAFAAALRIERPVVLGLSMGGRVAFQCAARHPQAVECPVIVDIAHESAAAGSQRIATGVRANDIFDNQEQAFASAPCSFNQ